MTDVSVIIPIYNGIETLRRAIDSALTQEGVDLEVIVVNDGSTDGSAVTLRTLYESSTNVKIIDNSRNLGISTSRNIAIDHASGTWIALIDADDRWEPRRLASMILAADEDDHMIADGLITFDLVADIETGPLFGQIGEKRLSLERALLGKSNQSDIDIGILKPIIRRNFINHNDIRYDPSLSHGEDLIFYINLLLAGAHLKILPEMYYIYSSPYGRISRQKSPYARSQRNGAAIADALDEIRKSKENVLNEAEKQAFIKKSHMVRDAAFWFDFEELIHEKKYRPALIMLMKWNNIKHAMLSDYFWSKFRRVFLRFLSFE